MCFSSTSSSSLYLRRHLSIIILIFESFIIYTILFIFITSFLLHIWGMKQLTVIVLAPLVEKGPKWCCWFSNKKQLIPIIDHFYSKLLYISSVSVNGIWVKLLKVYSVKITVKCYCKFKSPNVAFTERMLSW